MSAQRSTPGRAKLFRNGRSQAVRLPREFRFEGTEVRIRREGEAVVLEPVLSVKEWFARIDAAMEGRHDFPAREPQPPPQEREFSF